MTDTEMLDWLNDDITRLEDVRGWLNNTERDDATVRDAINELSSWTDRDRRRYRR